MKVSLNWLKDYVDITMGMEELAGLLTMAGLEVEEIRSVGGGFEKIVVAEIESVRRHPNADRLSLVKVKTDNERFSIVCGATNIKGGQRVPLALLGARLPNGTEIRKTKIRGETSEGMLCSDIELGLGQDAKGIMILSPHAPLGKDLGEALGMKDFVLDLSVTPNRPDCLSVIGVAREIAALTGQKVKYPSLSLSSSGEEIHRKTSVTILAPELCPRYVARLIEGVKIGPSPQWVKDRLERVGVRSISNVVDVTNYVMMESGQPLHAFDFELLEEERIVVRRAQQGEGFVTLDGVKRILDDQVLMICDGVKPVAIAGIMGGLNSEIREETKAVLLESAYFEPVGNRRTASKLGLETEAAYRFGRGIDHGGCLNAADRAAELIQELAGGRVLEGAVDAYPVLLKTNPIRMSAERVNRVLGTEIPGEKMESYLEGLELKVTEKAPSTFVVTPPSFRRDLEREIDLAEEIARMDGYEKIPVTLPRGSSDLEMRGKDFFLDRKITEVLIQHGYHEVVTYSFTSPASLDGIRLSADDPRRRFIRILNPLTEEFSILRTSLVPGLLEAARYNLSWKNSNLKIFEARIVFLAQEDEKLPREVRTLAGLAMGLNADPHWAISPRPVDFYDLKGSIEDLLEALQIRPVKFVRAENIPYLHPGKSASLFWEGEAFGVLGEVHPEVLGHYEIHGKAYLFEIDLDRMIPWAKEEKRFHPLPKFPAVYRDLSFVVDESLEAEKVVEAIQALKEPYLDEVSLFDVYRGVPISPGKKGVSYRMRYQAEDRTLTDEEVNQYNERVMARLKEIFPLELRQ